MRISAPSRSGRSQNGVNMVDPDYSSEELLSVTFDSSAGRVHTVNEDSLPGKRIFATMEIAGKSVRGGSRISKGGGGVDGRPYLLRGGRENALTKK